MLKDIGGPIDGRKKFAKKAAHRKIRSKVKTHLAILEGV